MNFDKFPRISIDEVRGWNLNGGFWYLANPYAHRDPQVMQERCRQVQAVAAYLMKQGVPVYRPIAHNHPIAVVHEMPRGWDFWWKLDEPMVDAAYGVLVLPLEGVEQSTGVEAEVLRAQSQFKTTCVLTGWEEVAA